jgi:3-phenylpropionate/trans-cinnamate dioxygenase ferredoxin reductase subunit
MSRMHSVSVGEFGSFRARQGEKLLDAALLNGIEFPHDCRSGHCGACRCNLVTGDVDGGQTDAPGSILACQARVASDLEIEVEETPPVETYSGRVRAIEELAGNVVEVSISLSRPLPYLPGQYCQFRFAGFPARCYSPTVPLDGPVDRDGIRLQIRRVPNGRLSTALGSEIRPGHKVKLLGPYGSAYLRPGRSNRLVLVAGGTGFAPIWSIAHAALCEMPDREIFVIAGANERNSLYMARALIRLVSFPKVQVAAVIRTADRPNSAFHVGNPLDFMPELTADDVIYAAGAPGMVEGVGAMARAAGACCYVDPFAPAAPSSEESFAWARKLLAAASPRQIMRRWSREDDSTDPEAIDRPLSVREQFALARSVAEQAKSEHNPRDQYAVQ